MKLSDHVDAIRTKIENAFDKSIARLGIGAAKQLELEKIPAEFQALRQRFDEMLDNHIGETGSYENARHKLLDELTFTLFNRIAAIKVMEAANLFPPIITKQSEHGDRSFGHKAWLEIRPDMRSEELEGIRDYIESAFDELAKTLPLYDKSFPYALLPDAISLNDIIDAFNEVEKDSQVESTIWQSDDILGWLYESYNNAKKQAFKDSGEKTEFDKVSLQSQVYTPRWVVQFLVENSLGKLYLEMYPTSEIAQNYKIANAPKTQERTPKPLHEIKLIDPASGSGNFLLYAFDFFYALYQDQIDNFGADYDEADIPKLIIEHNLHGIDLDDRAIQLAQLGLYIKARKKRRTVSNLKFNVVSSDFFLPDYSVVRPIFENGLTLDRLEKKLIADIWADLQAAYKFGSLIRLDEKLKVKLNALEVEQNATQEDIFGAEVKKNPVQLGVFTSIDILRQKKFIETFFNNLKIAVEQHVQTKNNTFISSKTRDAITFLELLTTQYDVATANPPYTDSSDFGKDLKTFIDDNYKTPFKFHINLYATFIKRCYEFLGENGLIAMVHPPTFMYIKTFEDVRKFIIENTHINFFVEWGYLGMFNPSARVDSALYILEKTKSNKDDVVFVKLNNLYETKRYDVLFEAYENYLAGKSHDLLFSIPQSKLKIIKSFPFIYWISDEFRAKFRTDSLDKYFNIKNGLQTGNNNKFLRFWWEVAADKSDYENSKRWILYGKGGPHNKWYGNLWTTVNVLETNSTSSSKGYYKEGVNFSGSSSKGTSFRYMPKGNMFDNDAPLIFPKQNLDINYLLGFINTKLASYTISCLNPTVKTQVGDIKRIPFVMPEKSQENVITNLAKIAISIKKTTCNFSIVEPDFLTSPINFLTSSPDIKARIKAFFNYENYLLTQVLINEAIINEKIFEIYELTPADKAMVLAKEGESIGGLPVCEEARAAYLEFNNTVRPELVEGCGEIKSPVRGELKLSVRGELVEPPQHPSTLRQAQGERELGRTGIGELEEFPLNHIQEFINALPVQTFTAEERAIVEAEFPALYQSNNDLEAFCIRHAVNPINVWAWFKQTNVIPKQRMNDLAMEFLADLIREILMEDEDGIIPLVPNAGGKVLLDRIEAKFIEKGFSLAQYSSFDSVLGKPLLEYLNKHFFAALSDHLNLFMYLPKTPFIWHLTSGEQQGFDCYVIIYKWSRDKLMRLRSVYLEHRERALMNRQSDLVNNDSADAQNEKDKIFKQLKEIEAFKVKIDELLAENYNPILDDGVGKNIAPLQKRKMLPYEVLNAGQLKKYLNADW